MSSPSDPTPARIACAEAALDALLLENLELAEPAVTRLSTERPQDPLGRYLRGRLAGRAGRWQEAMRAYQLLLVSPREDELTRWVQLAAGRLVRARQSYQEERLEALLTAPQPPDPVAGRLLVLPPEPVFFRETGEAAAARLEATAVSIASWMIGSLAQIPEVSPVDLHVTFLLRSSYRSATSMPSRPGGTVPSETGSDGTGSDRTGSDGTGSDRTGSDGTDSGSPARGGTRSDGTGPGRGAPGGVGPGGGGPGTESGRGRGGAASGPLSARASDDRWAAPPLNTILGVSHRLAKLSPQGPPPGDPDGQAPGHYYAGEPTGQWSQALARALSHFQAEHELPPTGMLDPATRQALEQAYRAAAARPALPRLELRERSMAMADPAQELGRLLGAEAVLSGTLEEEPSGQIRWKLVWVSPADGSLLSPPLAGALVPAQHAASWTQMIRQLLMYSPACQAAACEGVSIPSAPTAAGARAYGEAMLAVEAGRFAAAAARFRRAAEEGAGERAAWYGMAWELDPAGLNRLERDLLTRIARGAPSVAAGSLAQTGRVLSGGLLQGGGAGPTSGGWSGGSPLTYFPETSWLRISGHLEGR